MFVLVAITLLLTHAQSTLVAETVHEHARISAINKNFKSTTETFTHYFSELEKLHDYNLKHDNVDQRHHAIAMELISRQRSAVNEIFAPDSSTQSALIEMREDAEKYNWKHTAEAHPSRHHKNLMVLIDSQTEVHHHHLDYEHQLQKFNNGKAPLRFAEIENIEDKLKSGAKAVGQKILGGVITMLNAFITMLKALRTFIHTMLKSLFVGVGAEVAIGAQTHGAVILEFCFDMTGVFKSLMETGKTALEESQKDHVQSTVDYAWKAYKKEEKVTGELNSGEDGVDDTPANGNLFVGDIEEAVGGEAEVDNSNAETPEQSGDDMIDYVATEEGKPHAGKENIDAHEKSDNEKNIVKKGWSWLKKHIFQSCASSFNADALEFKICIPIKFHLKHLGVPVPGMSMIANSAIMKCVKSALSNIANEAWTKVVGDRKLSGKATEITETDLIEIKEPVEKLTKKNAKWMKHHSQRNSKFCKDYCTSLSPAFKSEHPNSLQWKGCTPANGFLNGRNGMYTDASNKKVDASKLEVSGSDEHLHKFHEKYCKQACKPPMDFSTSRKSKKTLPCISSLKFEDKISDIDTILENVVVDPKPAKSMDPCQCSMGDYPRPSIYDGSCQKVLKCSKKKFNEKRKAYCEALEMEDVDITDRDQKYEDEMPEDDTEMEDVEEGDEGDEIEEPTTDDEIVDMDLVNGAEVKCKGKGSGHSCGDTVNFVIALLPYFADTVGIDYDMFACGRLFSGAVINRFTNMVAKPKEISTADADTKLKAENVQKKIGNQIVLDQFNRNQENLEKGRCNPACAEVKLLNSISIGLPACKANYIIAMIAPIVISSFADSDHNHQHHACENHNKACNELKFELNTIDKRINDPETNSPLLDNDHDTIKKKYEELCQDRPKDCDHHDHHEVETSQENQDDINDLIGGRSFYTQSIAHEEDIDGIKGTEISQRILKRNKRKQELLNRQRPTESLLQTQIIQTKSHLRNGRHLLDFTDLKDVSDGDVIANTDAPVKDEVTNHFDEETCDGHEPALKLETVVSCGPVWQAGSCFLHGVKNIFQGLTGKKDSLRVCNEKCTLTSNTFETNPTCSQITSTAKVFDEKRIATETKEVPSRCVPDGMLGVEGTCQYCKGPGSPCRYNSDCASDSCIGTRMNTKDGHCSDSNHLAGDTCINDKECMDGLICRGALMYGKGVCQIDAVNSPNACAIKPEGIEAGCQCRHHKQCASKICYGSKAATMMGRGVCQYSERPVEKSCHDLTDCEACGLARARGTFSMHRCIWSPSAEKSKVEQWEGEAKLVVSRNKEGCVAVKAGRSWEENRYIDNEHKGMCDKKPEKTETVASCKEFKTCGECLQNTQTKKWSSSGGDCVWSVGKASRWEKWDEEVVEVKRTKAGCHKSQSDRKWDAPSRWIDAEHQEMCSMTEDTVNAVVQNQQVVCERASMTDKSCKRCDKLDNCQGTMVKAKSSFLKRSVNRCKCCHIDGCPN